MTEKQTDTDRRGALPASTQTRLNAFLAAELAILQAQEVKGDAGRAQRMAALADVREQIDKLQAQLNRETASKGISAPAE